MLWTLRTALTFEHFVETIKRDVIPTNWLVCQTLGMGKVEVAKVPVLEIFFCLCHNVMSLLLYLTEVFDIGCKVTTFLRFIVQSPHLFNKIKAKAGRDGSRGDRHPAMGTGTWGMRDKFKFYQKNLKV